VPNEDLAAKTAIMGTASERTSFQARRTTGQGLVTCKVLLINILEVQPG
jgi:hypothetical protein